MNIPATILRLSPSISLSFATSETVEINGISSTAWIVSSVATGASLTA